MRGLKRQRMETDVKQYMPFSDPTLERLRKRVDFYDGYRFNFLNQKYENNEEY
jgi:hypothetical protein